MGRSEKVRANARIHMLYEDTRHLPIIYHSQDPRSFLLADQVTFKMTKPNTLRDIADTEKSPRLLDAIVSVVIEMFNTWNELFFF